MDKRSFSSMQYLSTVIAEKLSFLAADHSTYIHDTSLPSLLKFLLSATKPETTLG